MPESRLTFTSLVVYRDPRRRYSFFFPEHWERTDLAGTDSQGVLFAPVASDPATGFSVEARDLGTVLTADDLSALREGFLTGLGSLADAAIESQEDYAVGHLIGFEARHTFVEDAGRRKRWTRLLYQGTTQARLIAQGATPDEFDRWLPAFTMMMRTFRFGDWWADATGEEWLPSLDARRDEEL